MMKKLLIATTMLLPLGTYAQDNTWEQPEEEQQEAVQKVNPDQKYLKGAVPEVDGKVVFTKTVECPGKTAAEVYAIVKQYMEKMTHEKNQLNSRIALDDPEQHEVTATYEEWLVFRSSALALDRTRFIYAMQARCEDGRATITLSHLRYLYDEARKALRLKAEEWITDREAVNKKNTRLLPQSGKFRRKTIDRKDFLFNKFETLLK